MVRSRLQWAGQFQVREGSNLVRADITLLPLPETLLATFAHELAHQQLLGSKRICADDQDHELVTDLATVLFGMGIFNANDSLRNRYRLNRRGDEIGRLGYLTTSNWGYALGLCAWLRDESKPSWAKWLRPAVRRVFRQSLAYLRKTGDAQVVEGGQLDAVYRVSLLKTEYRGLARTDFSSSGRVGPLGGEANQNQDAQADLKDAGKAETTCAETAALLFEASQFAEAGEWGKSNQCLGEAIRIEPDNATAYQQRTLVLLELGMIDAALRDAEAAMRLEPDDSESYLARGAAYMKVCRFEEAVTDLTQYLDHEDFLAASGRYASRGYYLRGLAYAGLRNYQRAIKDYSRAIQRWPDWPEPYEARAEAYEFIGNSRLANADRDEARHRATP